MPHLAARHRPISPPPATGSRGADLPAYLSNGVIGLRLRETPFAPGLCIVSGFAGEHHETHVEAAAAAPFPLGVDLALDGLWASDQAGAVEPLDQTYDFETAELTTRCRVLLGERTAEVETVAFCSRSHPTLVCQQTTITVDAACNLQWRGRVSVASLRGRLIERRLDTPGEASPVCDGVLLWESEGGLGRCGVAMITATDLDAARSQEPWDDLGPLSTTYALRAARGRRYVFRQMASLVPDVQHSQPHRQAVRLVAHAGQLGFDDLRRRNRELWADLWRGRIRLTGAEPRWQALLDAAYYYLNASVHASSPSSTSIYGLASWTDYHYYFGHVMWDVDAFAIPPVTLFQPQAARALLNFRSRTLPAARSNAQMLGRLGLKFPWEAAMRFGEEAAPGGGEAAAREDHVNIHVARAFLHFAGATGDDRFLREKAWPVVSGVSDWLADRVSRGSEGYDLLEGGGPAERKTADDNDAMTLMMGADLLRRATVLAGRLGLTPPDAWSEVAAGLTPPLRADGVIASHDGYRSSEEKGATPSPLMALFPGWCEVDAGTMQRTLDFYLSLWPDYVGSPMLPCLYGAWAAWAGDRDLSLKLFEEGYGAYQYGRFTQTLEYRLDKIPGVASGPFFANMGGFVTGVLLGLTGVRVSDADPRHWPSRPVVLPTGWTGVECDRLWIRGRPMRLTARHGDDRARLEPAED